ncbi:uncharacterized protein LOC129003233 isoform X2 [Macrosteles quadrilineatus]|uniref:uncharacterized protein LOC129003233 isoform X2 n=1 Tax=Macrosteles quadrilineatus TaxID=74068 RepID=UPI0023E2CEDC|nr:uncharacterized protein LOC129003233 isoform X2 [Macrosteles quadrilineatus]
MVIQIGNFIQTIMKSYLAIALVIYWMGTVAAEGPDAAEGPVGNSAGTENNGKAEVTTTENSGKTDDKATTTENGGKAGDKATTTSGTENTYDHSAVFEHYGFGRLSKPSAGTATPATSPPAGDAPK